MMHRLFILLSALCVLISPCAHAQGAMFFTRINDVPLMHDFYEDTAGGYVFDKPGGRVIEAKGIGPRTAYDAVLPYYQTTLPQFGWQAADADSFVRGGEKLDITTTHDTAHTYISIKIAPR